MINLSNFVDVNINYKISSSIVSTRDTAVLIKTHVKPTSVQPSAKNVAKTYGKGAKLISALVTTYTDIPEDDTTENEGTTYRDVNYVAEGDALYYYYSMFFQNGGQKLMVISVEGNDATALTLDKLQTIVKELDYKYVAITSTIDYIVYVIIVLYFINGDATINGCYKKKFITHITEAEYSAQSFNIDDITKVENFAIKYGLPGIEMTMAAYLTQINIDSYASVKDYAYTIEKVSYTYTSGGVTTTVGKAYSDNDLVVELMENQFNVDGDINGSIRNLGGNDFAGGEFVNYYMLILLHQTLTERLVGVLTQKIKYNPQGLSIIGSAIGTELDRYVNCGYISTNDAWTDDSLYYQGNLIIAKNTLLPLGYKYVVMPFSTLSETDRQEHKLPKIFVLISDGYSVRKIEIVGEVF